MTNPKSYLQEAKGRSLNLANKKVQLRKFLEDKKIDQDYDIIGGSRNQVFFNSFAGLSAAVYHKVPAHYIDDVVEEFKELDRPGRGLTFNNGIEYGTLPQFRLLFNCQPVVNDALRLLLYYVEKSSMSGKEKIYTWVTVIFQDFFKMKLPSDIINHKIEEFFENIPEEEIPPQFIEKADPDIEITRQIINKWIDNEQNPDADAENNSVSELGHESIVLKKDDSFAAFIPLMKKNQIMYCPPNVYCFLRFFFVMYERLLKVKMVLSQQGKENPPIEVGSYEFSDQVEIEYLGFLKFVCLVLKNTYDSTKFEDKCRTLLGNDAYVLFTFDKLTTYTAKALHTLAHDELNVKSLPLFKKFSKNRLNEEVYMSEFLRNIPSHQLFRLHWNTDFKILCITYIESPYEKLQEPTIKNYLKYSKTFDKPTQETTLEDELKFMHERLDVYYQNYSINQSELANSMKYCNGIKIGLNESSYKMHFVPEHEDWIYNTKYYQNDILIATQEETYVCQDKNSFIQKITELGQRKFQRWRDENQK